MREGFLLDPEVAYLNHGSFGACAEPVFEEYQRLQRDLEREPTDFLGRGLDGSMRAARGALASYVGARTDDLVFVPNATSGLNAVLRSLAIRPEEEILTTLHEYGAIQRILEYVRANVVACEPEDVVGSIGVRTRAVLVSHVTSPTARVLPVEEICEATRRAGVLTIVDGAHAPGQLPLNVAAVGADIYAGNCHKWLGAPKGSGFLWARREHHAWIDPLVISWGYHDDADFGERHGWQGTRDPAAFLAVPKAIEVHATFDLERMVALADLVEQRLDTLGIARLDGGTPAPFMRAFSLRVENPEALSERLFEEHRVEVPAYEWGGRAVLRVSVGPYTDEGDLDRLVVALGMLL